MVCHLVMTRKGAFEDTAYGIIDAAKLYYTEASLESSNINETFTFPNDNKLKISGKKPTIGSVELDKEGKIALAISNETWCAIKSKNEEKVSIIDYSVENCVIPIETTAEICFTVNETGEIITDYTCTDKNVVIPNKIKGVIVTGIGEYAFAWNKLISVKIPNSVTTIGDNAFYENQLTSVEIPNSVTTIGEDAFHYNQLTSIEIPNSVTTIGSGAFHTNHVPCIKWHQLIFGVITIVII